MTSVQWLTLGICAWIWNGQTPAFSKVALAWLALIAASLSVAGVTW